MSTAIRFEQVSVHVGTGRRRHTILDRLDLHVSYGSAVALTGPSGSGKTTALRVAACAVLPSAGRAEVLGWDTRLVRGARIAALRQRVGIVPQASPYGREHRSVEDTLLRNAHATGRAGGAISERLAEVLELTGTDLLARSDVQNLSVGESRRVSIARALLARPHVLLLDEPTANLDDGSAEAILRLILNAREAGLAVLATTHDPRVVEAADLRVELAAG